VNQIKKAQGKLTGGRRAFGYEVIDLAKVPKPDEQEVISEMRTLRGMGESYRDIEKWMSEKEKLNISAMGSRSDNFRWSGVGRDC
jgi:putative DNA-invertase from lambdoid prophage Rac